jgi:hypothetical protein
MSVDPGPVAVSVKVPTPGRPRAGARRCESPGGGGSRPRPPRSTGVTPGVAVMTTRASRAPRGPRKFAYRLYICVRCVYLSIYLSIYLWHKATHVFFKTIRGVTRACQNRCQVLRYQVMVEIKKESVLYRSAVPKNGAKRKYRTSHDTRTLDSSIRHNVPES